MNQISTQEDARIVLVNGSLGDIGRFSLDSTIFFGLDPESDVPKLLVEKNFDEFVTIDSPIKGCQIREVIERRYSTLLGGFPRLIRLHVYAPCDRGYQERLDKLKDASLAS